MVGSPPHIRPAVLFRPGPPSVTIDIRSLSLSVRYFSSTDRSDLMDITSSRRILFLRDGGSGVNTGTCWGTLTLTVRVKVFWVSTKSLRVSIVSTMSSIKFTSETFILDISLGWKQ